eukprot:m.119288 g.119288  ORF g.119288 m.119288 type:complete len:355 (+) comp13676_c1_seq2:2446-3510(+)
MADKSVEALEAKLAKALKLQQLAEQDAEDADQDAKRFEAALVEAKAEIELLKAKHKPTRPPVPTVDHTATIIFLKSRLGELEQENAQLKQQLKMAHVRADQAESSIFEANQAAEEAEADAIQADQDAAAIELRLGECETQLKTVLALNEQLMQQVNDLKTKLSLQDQQHQQHATPQSVPAALTLTQPSVTPSIARTTPPTTQSKPPHVIEVTSLPHKGATKSTSSASSTSSTSTSTMSLAPSANEVVKRAKQFQIKPRPTSVRIRKGPGVAASRKKTGKEALLAWCKARTEGYKVSYWIFAAAEHMVECVIRLGVAVALFDDMARNGIRYGQNGPKGKEAVLCGSLCVCVSVNQ